MGVKRETRLAIEIAATVAKSACAD